MKTSKQKKHTDLPIGQLKPHPENPQRHSAHQIQTLARLIDHFGWRSSILVSRRSGFIVAGHARLAAAKQLNLTSVPVSFQDFASDADERAFLLADNQVAALAETDQDDLRRLIAELSPEAREFTGLSDQDIAILLEPPPEKMFDVPETLPGAMALKPDMQFPSKEPFGIPHFLPEKLAACPESIATWAGPDASGTSDHWFYNLGTDSVRGLDFSRTILGFYTDDARFEGAWDDPERFTTKILNRSPLAVISPNFSLWFEAPPAVKIWNTYRSRWLGRYFQEAGLRLIPDVNFSDPPSFDYCFAGIPRGAPCLAMQIQTAKKTTEEIAGKRAGLAEAVKRLAPQTLLLYVGDNSEAILDGLLPRTLPVISIANRVQKRRAVMDKERKKK